MAGIYEMAKELGGALARTDEYQTLKQTGEAVDQERDLVELKNRLQELEAKIQASLRAGQQPDEEVTTAYQTAAEELQAKPVFQRFVAAQANFEKVMYKVNETMAQGLQEGAQSKIILSS
jgi:cell fate (sporulation/competence/biofilm development) regulator YlbF (YheA/YmcA/DUF963 family)